VTVHATENGQTKFQQQQQQQQQQVLYRKGDLLS